MEPLLYQPDGDPIPHEITAEVIEEEAGGSALIFSVKSDGEKIGEVDVWLQGNGEGFISGVSEEEKINNGYLRPAAFVIAACLHERNPAFKNFIQTENQLI
jgi:hypothetical protein